MEPAADAEIILEGDNTLTGAAGYAALAVGYVSGSEMADLTLSGDGSLTAAFRTTDIMTYGVILED